MPADQLGQIISGQALAAPPGPPPGSPSGQLPVAPTGSADPVRTNLDFFRRPDVKAGLLQLGVSLLSPNGNIGTALGDAFGASGRYTTQQRQLGIDAEQREIQGRTAEADIGETQARTASRSADAAATTAGIGQRNQELTIQKQGAELAKQKLGLDRERIGALKDYYRAQARYFNSKAGLTSGTLTDDALFDAGIKIYVTGQETQALLNEGTGKFDPVAFGETINGIRQQVGRPPLPALQPGQENQLGGAPSQLGQQRQVVDADKIRQLKAEGVSREDLMRLQEKFDLTPEAIEELFRRPARRDDIPQQYHRPPDF